MTYIENLKPSKNIRQWNLIKKKKQYCFKNQKFAIIEIEHTCRHSNNHN